MARPLVFVTGIRTPTCAAVDENGMAGIKKKLEEFCAIMGPELCQRFAITSKKIDCAMLFNCTANVVLMLA